MDGESPWRFLRTSDVEESYMGIVLVIAAIAVGYLIYTRYANGKKGDVFGSRRSSLEIAEERYARGEIDREEFEKIKEDLNG